MVVREVQLLNAPKDIFLIVLGILNEERELHPSNICISIVVHASGHTTDSSCRQRVKVLRSILVTEVGITIDFNPDSQNV